MDKRLLGFFILFSIMFASGCSESRVNMSVASMPNVNPDYSGRPSPVVVKVYELRNDLLFKQTDFQSLFDKPIQILGADLIAADELVFIPGEARTVAYKPNANTKYLGIVAGFRQMERSLWRVIKKVNPEEENWIAIEFNDTSIISVPDKDAEDWDPEKAVKNYQQQLIKPEQPADPKNTPTTVSENKSSPNDSSVDFEQNKPVTAPPSTDSKESVTILRDNMPVTDANTEGASGTVNSNTPSYVLPPMRSF